MRVSYFVTINITVLFACFCESALTPEIRKIYHRIMSGKGLYVDEDGITILNATNFQSTVYNKTNAWLVEFYNSWCGHCHKFAPVWKALAIDYYDWRNVVQLAAIDCAHDDHNSLCRDYNIMAYPTVKFFPAGAVPANLGMEFPKGMQTEREITRLVVGLLQKEQTEGRGSHWPNLTPYRGHDTSDLWLASSTVQFFIFIFASRNDTIATEVILDFSTLGEEVVIRSAVPENEPLSKLLGVVTYPSVLVLEKSKSEPMVLRPRDKSRDSFRATIRSFLLSRNVSLPKERPFGRTDGPTPSLGELINAKADFDQLQAIKDMGDVVFLVDLENTLRYSLEHEVPSKKSITGDALTALNNYLRILNKYFPLSDSGAQQFQKFSDVIMERTEVTGQEFKDILNAEMRGGLQSILASNHDWLGCRGSETHLRRYPCGVWTLFHFMTVGALADSGSTHFDPLEVLEAMLGYIRHFFGCTECSKHFQQMAEERGMRTAATTAEEAVLWLWSAHNNVNKRLALDKSEDPEFPKVQFPSEKRCETCRGGAGGEAGDWNRDSVLAYLKTVYSLGRLSRMGSNESHVRSGPDYNHQRKSELFEDVSLRKITRDFNVFDISLCVVLYIVSAFICVAVCLKFVLKKKHRRKSNGLDLLGRV